MKIGLTRLTSTPLIPTGSKAEACQPLRVFFAAWQGRAAGAIGEVAETGHPLFSLYRKKIIKILLLSLIGTFRKTGKPIHSQPPVSLVGASRREVVAVTLTCSRNRRFGLTCLRPTPVRV